MTPVPFSVVTALTPLAPGRFAADVHPEWTIAGKPNGGYLLALLGRAAARTGEHEHVLAASGHYLRPPEPGAATVEAEVLRAGRTASQLRVRLVQHGKPCVEALVTTSRLDPDVKPYWDGGVPRPSAADPGAATRMHGHPPNGAIVPIMDQVALSMERETLGWTVGRPSGRGELRGWLRLPDGEPFDPISLLYAVDAFPPATFEVEMTGWVPTLELTAYVRALPAPGPVQVTMRAGLIEGQRTDETCWVWDSTGRLVAQATQLAGVRLG